MRYTYMHNVGLPSEDSKLKALLSEVPGQCNFTHFLTLFGEKLHGKIVVPIMRPTKGICSYPLGSLAPLGWQ